MNHFLKRFISFCIFLILIVTAILLYSHYIGTTGLNINEYAIHNSSISNDIYGLKIVQITDIHYGRTVHESELKKMVEKINLTKPDIVVFTGDLIDKDTTLTEDEEKKVIEILSNIDADIGKYAISGDQDDSNQNYWNLMENSGFINLDDTYQTIYFNSSDYILLAGIHTNENNIENKTKEVLNYIETSELKPNYTILLLHKPDYIDLFDSSKFNLILAGHSLNGQIRLPILGALIKPNGAKKYYESHYSLNSNDIYISSGLGTTEISFRLFNHPSFNLYRLIN